MNTELPNQPEEDAALEVLLKESVPYVDDAGFTARVVAALPRRRPGLARKIFLISASGIGFVFAAIWLPWQQLGPLWNDQLTLPNNNSAGAWMAVLTVLASLAWTMSSALSDEPEWS